MLALLLAAAIAAPLRIDTEPHFLELGDDSARALVHIREVGPGIEPRVSANVGTIANLRRDDAGGWTAEYVPPADAVPQVALISAVAGDELSWTALPLSGQGTAVVQTRPGAEISVEIGDRSFGPVHADRHGEALVPVVVPPGVHQVLHLGHPIDLPVPPMLRLHVVLMNDHVRADRSQKVRVRVLVVDAKGKPAARAKLVFHPGRGNVSAPERHGPGEMWALWTLSKGRAGSVPLRVTLAGEPELVAGTALAIGSGPAASVELSADRESIVAGAGNEVVLRATALDSAGNASIDPLELSAPAGFGTVIATGPSSWRLRAPDSFAGRTSMELNAHPRGRAAPGSTVTVRLVPAEPVSASMDPQVASVRTGYGTLKLHVRRTDRFGNLVQGAAPEPSAQEGSVGPVETLADGSYLASYRAPPRWDREDAVVAMRWPEMEARSRLTLLPRLAPLALSPALGLTSNFARYTSPLAALSASYRTDRFGPELAVSGEAAWSFVSTRQAVGALGTAQAHDDFVALSAQLSYRRKLGIRTTLFAGAGPSLEVVASRLQLSGQPRISETALVPGAVLSLGVEHRFAHALPFAELRWSVHQDPGLVTLSGAVSAVSLLLGNRFELL